jgi:hypothetical protein
MARNMAREYIPQATVAREPGSPRKDGGWEGHFRLAGKRIPKSKQGLHCGTGRQHARPHEAGDILDRDPDSRLRATKDLFIGQ